MLNATPDVKTKTGVAIFAALKECVVGLDGPAAGVMEQWEKETAMCVLKRKVNINLTFHCKIQPMVGTGESVFQGHMAMNRESEMQS